MNFLIIFAIFFLCSVIGIKNGITGVLALFLCAFCFFWGSSFYSNIVAEKAKNGVLMEINGKYYAIKYVKDKVE